MKITTLILATWLLSTPLLSHADSPALSTDDQKLSYVFGAHFGQRLALEKIQIDMEALSMGFRDRLAGKTPKIDQASAEKIQKRYQTSNQLKLMAANKKKRDDAAAFLIKNAAEKDVTTTKSGLQYRLIKQGEGASPNLDDSVVVNIVGKETDGTVLMDSYKEGFPSTIAVNDVVRGWSEALQLMKVGAKLQAVMPPHLLVHVQAKDDEGPVSGEPLIFDFELLSIKP